MRKSPLALLLSLICLISSHNEIQAQGHPPTDSLRQRAAASVGKEKHDLLMRIAMSTNDIADWDATLNDAIDRYDTPAICQSRLNRIQCLFNFYSVDSATTVSTGNGAGATGAGASLEHPARSRPAEVRAKRSFENMRQATERRRIPSREGQKQEKVWTSSVEPSRRQPT